MFRDVTGMRAASGPVLRGSPGGGLCAGSITEQSITPRRTADSIDRSKSVPLRGESREWRGGDEPVALEFPPPSPPSGGFVAFPNSFARMPGSFATSGRITGRRSDASDEDEEEEEAVMWCPFGFRPKRSRVRKIVFFSVVVPAVIFGARRFGNADALRAFSRFAAMHPVLSPFALCLIVALVLAFSVPGISLWVAMGGMVVQPWLVAALAAWVGHIIGAVLNWMTFGGERPHLCGRRSENRRPVTPVEDPEPEDDAETQAERNPCQNCVTLADQCVRSAMHRWWLLTLLRMIPPLFAPVTLAMVYFEVPFRRFLWTTALGSLPPQLILCFYARWLRQWLTGGVETDIEAPPGPDFDDTSVKAHGVQGSVWLWAFRQHFLPPRLSPWLPPAVVCLAWLTTLLGGAAFGWRGWRLPASRMWRRFPMAHHPASMSRLHSRLTDRHSHDGFGFNPLFRSRSVDTRGDRQRHRHDSTAVHSEMFSM
eukprot:TRINITY_DN21274_c0_g1_i1.p1 TRINITY_DN21274_c0_g1~~TRINITY_DN21274_c0_g1_i1.p1  ORF type:complete len:482 (+),score=64.78 TRINITY_DN21274_c0_g1_i1:44-1489(+)